MGVLILLGLLCVVAGGEQLRRGRGGRMTRDGAVISLIGFFCLFVAFHSAIGTKGIVALLCLGIVATLGEKLGLRKWLEVKIKDWMDGYR